MEKELTAFERHMRNCLRKRKRKEDEELLDEMLIELKEKLEKERQEKIAFHRKELDKLGVENGEY